METLNLGLVIVVLSGVAGAFVGTMLWAYQGSGSVAVLFREVMPVPEGLSDAARSAFQSGVSTYIAGNYRPAIGSFSKALQADPSCQAARHNRGLAYANLRQEDSATINLLAAAEGYGAMGDRKSVALVKRQLEAIRLRKLSRETPQIAPKSRPGRPG
jgi:tetratricopeptide (TPR) repeat protein